MLDVFLFEPRAGSEVGSRIQERLERTAEARVIRDVSDHVGVSWEAGLASGAIILVLSPQSVPERIERSEWESLLAHVSGNAMPPVATVRTTQCVYPKLLERRNHFVWNDRTLDVPRGLERFVIAAHAEPRSRPFAPRALPWFEGRASDLEQIWALAVDRAGVAFISGPPSIGKSALAQQFAHQASAHFRDILWIGCGDRSPASIACELAEKIGVVLEGSLEEASRMLADSISRHRLLMVFDDADSRIEPLIPRAGWASAIVTTRQDQPGSVRLMAPPARHMEVNENLWRAASACRPQSFALDLAWQIAGGGEGDAGLDPLGGGYCRLARPHPDPDYAAHAAAVHAVIRDWVRQPEAAHRALPEAPFAIEWLTRHDWPKAAELGRWTFALLQSRRRTIEAIEIMQTLLRHAESRGDAEVIGNCRWELSWIHGQDRPAVRQPDARMEQLGFDF